MEGKLLFDLDFIALDVETTGIDENSEIIKIGLVKVQKGEIVDTYQSLIKPERPIPEEITLLTGITNEMVFFKPSWTQVEQDILAFIGESILIAHNAPFDKQFLEKACSVRLSNTWIDTCELAKITLPTFSSYKLMYLAQVLKLPKLTFHRALDDAQTCAYLFLKLIDSLKEFPPTTLNKILTLLNDEKSGNSLVLQLAQKYAVRHYAFKSPAFFTNEEKKNEEVKSISIKFSDCGKFLEPGGLLDLSLVNYQYRPQQINMLNTVSSALQNEKHAILEAGTGIGKSLAYLIPGLLWALENSCKVVIATHTIALQEQLFKKDIPFLESCFQRKLPVALIKGRSNYICLRRFQMLISQGDRLSWAEKIFLAQVINWLENTAIGDKEELNLNKQEDRLWQQISSQTETCLGNKCSFYLDCYFMNNRRLGEKSSLIITNHALLLQDIKIDNKILPKYDYVIIDEAHNLEEEAIKQFASLIDLEEINKLAYQLGKGKNTGLLNRLKILINDSENKTNILELVEIINEDLTLIIEKISVIKEEAYSQKELAFVGEKRITAKERKEDWWIVLENLLIELSNLLFSLNNKLVRLINQIDILDGLEEIMKEIAFRENQIFQIKNDLKEFLEFDNPNYVYWLELNDSFKYKNLTLIFAPIDINNLLREYLFSAKKSVILTSATLAVNRKLEYTADTYGLEKGEYLTFIADSPFDYQKQALLCVPKDIPDPSQISDEEYAWAIAQSIKKIVPHVTGGILVLFTSYKMLNYVYLKLKKEDKLLNREVLAHGKDGSRTNLVEALKNNPNTIVLGTNSFWEGIDISGLGLTTVIITKLPFYPPSRPIIAAKLEKMESEGKNSFYKFSIPQAVLRFRQGYGRLIRSDKDFGTVIVLDKRIMTKRYGQQFINSLPTQSIIYDTIDKISEVLNLWMHNKIIAN